RIIIKVASTTVHGRIISAETPLQLIEEYTTYSGRMRPLPDWAVNGVIAGIQGGEAFVKDAVTKAKAAGVPISAVWLQDWCGKREQKVLGRILKRLWWNWESDDAFYPNWSGLVKDLGKEKVHVLTYVNTFLADVSLQKATYRRNLYQEARDRNFLVRAATGDKPLAINSGPNFQAGLVDLFNPAAYAWLREVMIKDVYEFENVKGFMADFAEFLPPGAILSGGRIATSAHHNEYAELWAKLQKEAAEVVGHHDKVFFHRSGFTKSPGYASLFWTGDQLVSWDAYDGIKAGLVGLLSSGLSGFSLNHSDVGGYSSLSLTIFGQSFGNARSKELLLRWMELGAFGAVYRTHEGSMPQVNAQFYDDEVTLRHFAITGQIFASLAKYKKTLMLDAAQRGYPVVRHMYLHFFQDPEVYKLNQQFLLGEHILIRPVLDPNTNKVRVYLPKLPAGRKWIDAYTSLPADVAEYPAWITKSAPLGKPAVFVDEVGASLPSISDFLNVMHSLKDKTFSL
ncbi:hypothetical protein HDU76_011613, partial [Blyttiomyces sp. JEL0837]